VRVCEDGRAIAHVGERDAIVRAVSPQKLARVGAPAQALVAVAALRRARDAHAIANGNPSHFGTDGFDDADAAVALDQRRVVRPRGAGLKTEHRADVRVTEIRCFSADEHLPAADRP
jgi:hypothetical protein